MQSEQMKLFLKNQSDEEFYLTVQSNASFLKLYNQGKYEE